MSPTDAKPQDSVMHVTRRITTIIAALAFAAAVIAVAGCGQSGPLYLPPPKAKQPAAQRPAPSRTAPAAATR